MSYPGQDESGVEDESKSMRSVAKADETGEGEEVLSIINDEAYKPDSGAYGRTSRRMWQCRLFPAQEIARASPLGSDTDAPSFTAVFVHAPILSRRY